MKICKICKIEKLETEYYRSDISKDKLRYECKSCSKNDVIKYRKLNPYNHKKACDKYRRKRLKDDYIFRLQEGLRVRLRNALNSKQWKKNTHFSEYIGCSLNELITHLETQFKPGMTWKNRGLHGWHIDHIIPLSSAKTEEELYKLCHYTNLQPLWAKENFDKKAKIIEVA